MNPCRDCVETYVHFFENLNLQSLDRIDVLFSDTATFKDPFNAVQGRQAIRRVFEHMFRTTVSPRFQVRDWMCSGQSACVRWRFTCTLKGRGIDVSGMTHLSFDHDGRVNAHVDYWDAAGGLYERLPLIGMLMRWLRERLAA